MNSEKIYSVGQLSEMAGVSIRTLHHYDKIGLLPAKRNKDNDYREYDQYQLALLLQIVIYRKLGFTLDEILTIVSSDDYDLFEALTNQRNMLLTRQQETLSMINSIEVAMSILKGKNYLERVLNEFPDKVVEPLREKIENHVGNEELEKNLAALGNLSESEFEFEFEQNEKWLNEYSKLVSLSVDSPEVQDKVKDHYVLNNRMYMKTSVADYQGVDYREYLQIADTTLSDPVSRGMYEHYQSGMAEHLHEAMIFFAENSLKDNETQFMSLC